MRSALQIPTATPIDDITAVNPLAGDDMDGAHLHGGRPITTLRTIVSLIAFGVKAIIMRDGVGIILML